MGKDSIEIDFNDDIDEQDVLISALGKILTAFDADQADSQASCLEQDA